MRSFPASSRLRCHVLFSHLFCLPYLGFQVGRTLWVSRSEFRRPARPEASPYPVTSTVVTSVSALCSLLFLFPISVRAENLVSKPVGVVQIKVSEKAQSLVSLPFQPFSNTLDVALSGQMTGSTNEKSADHLFKWDSFISAYRKAVKADGTGNPELDGKWVDDLQSFLPSDLTLEPGEGFFLENRQGSTQSVFLVGKVLLNEGRLMLLLPSLNLFGPPYPAPIPLEDAALPAGAGDIVLDQTGTKSPASLEPGRGYWCNREADDAIVWTEIRPFANPFPANDDPPSIELISITPQKGALLSIRCAGEKLDIFFKDAAPTNSFDPIAGWQIAESDMAVTGKSSIQWTDNGGAERLPVKDVFARYYLVARADIDDNQDGVPDARARFCGTSAASLPQKRPVDAVSRDETQSAGTKTESHTKGRIIYVDANRGNDEQSGFRSDLSVPGHGPKRTIPAGIFVSEDTVYVAEGIYQGSGKVSTAGRRMVTTGNGKVVLK